MTFLKRTIACMALVFVAAFGGNATAEIYSCKLKSGKVEMRDFPCDLAGRPAAPQHSVTAKPERTPYPAPSNVNAAKAGFDNLEQYQAARRICLGLLSQYDTLKPMMRCSIEDKNCLRLAGDEISALSRQMTAHPDWKRQQCDLVVQMESAASAPQGCSSAQIVKPMPFLGTAEEVITLSDGSVWKDLSYKYLYLYAYSPVVQICAAQGKMILEHGGRTHTFSLMRLK